MLQRGGSLICLKPEVHAVNSSNVTAASKRQVIPACLLCTLQSRAMSQSSLCLQSLSGFLRHFSFLQMKTGLETGQFFSPSRDYMPIPFLNKKQG